MIKLYRRALRRGAAVAPESREGLRGAGRQAQAAASLGLGAAELDPQLLAQLRELQDWAESSRTETPAPVGAPQPLAAAAEDQPGAGIFPLGEAHPAPEPCPRSSIFPLAEAPPESRNHPVVEDPAASREPAVGESNQTSEIQPGSPAAMAGAAGSFSETPASVVAYRESTPDLEPLRMAASAFLDELELEEAPMPEAAPVTPRAVPVARSAQFAAAEPQPQSESRFAEPASVQPQSPPQSEDGGLADGTLDRAARGQAAGTPERADRGQMRTAQPVSELPGGPLPRRPIALPSRRMGKRPALRPSRWAAALVTLLLLTALAGYLRSVSSWRPAPAPPPAGAVGSTGGAGANGPEAAGSTGSPASTEAKSSAPARPIPVPPPPPRGWSAAAPTAPRSSPAPSTLPRSEAAPSTQARSEASSSASGTPRPEPLAQATPPSSPASSPTATSATSKARVGPHPAGRHAGLLHPGPGVRPPVLVSVPPLKLSGAARRHHILGRLLIAERRHAVDHIELEVLVTETGYVSRAQVRGGDKAQIGYDRAALQAAMAARFRPATRYGVPGSMWTQLSFDVKD